jgi:hypothetical protein
MPLKDRIREIKKFQGMNSYSSPQNLLDSEFAALINMYAKGDKIATRPPNKKVFIGTTHHGQITCIGAEIFESKNLNCIVYALSNGQCFYWRDGDATPTEIVDSLTGLAPLNGNGYVTFDRYLAFGYIADGINLFKINFSTNKAIKIDPAKLALISTPQFVKNYGGKLGVIDEEGGMLISKQEIDIELDSEPFNLVASGEKGFYNSFAKGDGQIVTGVEAGDKVLLICKNNKEQKKGSLYELTGTSFYDFQVNVVSSSVSFIGDSIANIGKRLFGLTQNKFDFLNTLNQFGVSIEIQNEEGISNFGTGLMEDDIKDIIDSISSNNLDKVKSVYSVKENAYYCALAEGESAVGNNLIVRIAMSNNAARISLFTNVRPKYLFYLAGYVHYMDYELNIWRMMDERQETKDSGYEEGAYHKLVILKDYDLDAPGLEKRIQKVVPEITLYGKTEKQLEFSWKSYIKDTASEAIKIETNRKTGTINPKKHKLIPRVSFRANRFSNSLSNEDQFNEALFQSFRPAISIETQALRFSFMISDYSADSNGTGGWELSSILLKGKIVQEEK